MKINYSVITRRTFLNTLLGGGVLALLSGVVTSVLGFAFPTLGKEPDFVVLKANDYLDIPPNSAKAFAWGGKLGLLLKKEDGSLLALKGVCTHMDCNVTYKPEEGKFYCPCHQGWYDENGKNIKGPPPRPLETFEHTVEGDKLIVARRGVKVELPKA